MNRVDEYHNQLFQAQEKAVRMYHPEFTEDQVATRCSELKNIIITKEDINYRFMNERLNKIWKSKSNERKFY